MKILAVSDEESDTLWSGRGRELAGDVDVIVSCGDLRPEYLEFLLTMINAPLLYVLGNHDGREPEGGICLEGRVLEVEGVRFLGLGGCMRYRQGANMYSEGEMRGRYWGGETSTTGRTVGSGRSTRLCGDTGRSICFTGMCTAPTGG